MKIKNHGLLSENEIREFMDSSSKPENRLFISPLLESNQINSTSIDLRIGNRLLIPKASKVGVIDILELSYAGDSLTNLFEEIRLPLGKFFLLHPKSTVQIGTLEYLGIPYFLEGIVTLRASVSNASIVANTAQVHPGHRGVITLTLTNMSSKAITLYPGLRIAEMRLHYLSSMINNIHLSRYHNKTKPVPTKWHEDFEIRYLGPTNNCFIIGIVSTIGAGRTTALTHLEENRGYYIYSLAQTLRSEARRQGIPIFRENLQSIGNQIRQTKDPGYLALQMLTNPEWLSSQTTVVIVDGFKHPEEVSEFRNRGNFILLGIDASVDLRWKRLEDRSRDGDPKSRKEFDKQDKLDRGLITGQTYSQRTNELLEMADEVIQNDSTFDDLEKNIDEYIGSILGINL